MRNQPTVAAQNPHDDNSQAIRCQHSSSATAEPTNSRIQQRDPLDVRNLQERKPLAVCGFEKCGAVMASHEGTSDRIPDCTDGKGGEPESHLEDKTLSNERC